jgi:hypothetical protein
MTEPSLKIKEFCQIEKISKGAFYELDRNGKAPLTYWIGTTRRITPESHQKWRTEREAEAQARRQAAAEKQVAETVA